MGHKGIAAFDAVHKIGSSLDHALVDHLLERLFDTYRTDVVEELRPKPGIQQVAGGVFRTSNVKVNCSPVVGFRFICKAFLVFGIGVAEKIPA